MNVTRIVQQVLDADPSAATNALAVQLAAGDLKGMMPWPY